MDERDEKIDRLSAENISLHEELSKAKVLIAALSEELEDTTTMMKDNVERAERAERKADTFGSVLGNAFRYCGNFAGLPPQQVDAEIDAFADTLHWPTDHGGHSIMAVLKHSFELHREDYRSHIHLRLQLGSNKFVYAIAYKALKTMPAPQLAQYLRESIVPTATAQFVEVLKQRYTR